MADDQGQTSEDDEAVNLFKDRAVDKYGPNIAKMILFGSVARGSAGPDSDIDILVLWNGDRFEGLKDLGVIAFNMIIENNSYISLKVMTPEDFEVLRKRNSGFIKNILREGKVLVG